MALVAQPVVPALHAAVVRIGVVPEADLVDVLADGERARAGTQIGQVV